MYKLVEFVRKCLLSSKKDFISFKSRHIAGPIAERSNSLDRGQGDPSSNPGEGSYGDGKQRIIEGYYSHD